MELHLHSHVCIQSMQRQLYIYKVKSCFKCSQRQALRGKANHYEHSSSNSANLCYDTNTEHYTKYNQTVKTQCVLYADLRVELLGENTKPLIRVNQFPRRTTGYRLNSIVIPFCQLQLKPVITTSVMRYHIYCVS